MTVPDRERRNAYMRRRYAENAEARAKHRALNAAGYRRRYGPELRERMVAQAAERRARRRRARHIREAMTDGLDRDLALLYLAADGPLA